MRDWRRHGMEVVTHLLPEGSDLDRRASRWRAPQRPGRPRAQPEHHVLRHLRRAPARRRADAAPRGGRLALLDRATGEELAPRPRHRRARGCSTTTCPSRCASGSRDVIEMRALTPVARVRTRARSARGPQRATQKTVVRLTVETHAASLHGASAADRGARLRPATSSASTASSPRRSSCPRRPSRSSTRRSRPPAATPGGHERQAQRRARPRRARQRGRRRVFTRLLEVIGDNLPGTLDDVDSEFLHDLRVAVRRTR